MTEEFMALSAQYVVQDNNVVFSLLIAVLIAAFWGAAWYISKKSTVWILRLVELNIVVPFLFLWAVTK